MRLSGREIAVIGAGLGGLAAALALAARRARVTVYEQAPTLGEVGAGIQVAPNGVAVLEALGLRDAAETAASLPEAVELRDWRGDRAVARIPLGQACVARYGRPYWQFHRADLLAVLAAGAAEAGVAIRLGCRIATVEACGEGVRLRPESGPETLAELVVAADGVRSGVRAARFGGAAPRFTGHVAWRGLVAAGRLPEPVAPVTCVTMGPGRHLVSYPLRGGRQTNVVAIEERAAWTAEGWTEPDDPDRLRRAFAGWGGMAGALLAAVDETFLWGLFDHPPLPAWAQGRIALLGDACHPMLPFLAQGATMALEDAWVLAAELDVADSPEAGLVAYESRRVARATRVQRAAARNGRLYHLRGLPAALARAGLSATSAVAPGAALRRLDWLFGADETRWGA